jgi:hypothetical protein
MLERRAIARGRMTSKAWSLTDTQRVAGAITHH